MIVFLTLGADLRILAAFKPLRPVLSLLLPGLDLTRDLFTVVAFVEGTEDLLS